MSDFITDVLYPNDPGFLQIKEMMENEKPMQDMPLEIYESFKQSVEFYLQWVNELIIPYLDFLNHTREEEFEKNAKSMSSDDKDKSKEVIYDDMELIFLNFNSLYLRTLYNEKRLMDSLKDAESSLFIGYKTQANYRLMTEKRNNPENYIGQKWWDNQKVLYWIKPGKDTFKNNYLRLDNLLIPNDDISKETLSDYLFRFCPSLSDHPYSTEERRKIQTSVLEIGDNTVEDCKNSSNFYDGIQKDFVVAANIYSIIYSQFESLIKQIKNVKSSMEKDLEFYKNPDNIDEIRKQLKNYSIKENNEFQLERSKNYFLLLLDFNIYLTTSLYNQIVALCKKSSHLSNVSLDMRDLYKKLSEDVLTINDGSKYSNKSENEMRIGSPDATASYLKWKLKDKVKPENIANNNISQYFNDKTEFDFFQFSNRVKNLFDQNVFYNLLQNYKYKKNLNSPQTEDLSKAQILEIDKWWNTIIRKKQEKIKEEEDENE